MARITSRYQGNVSDEAVMNWRGDQTVAPQGGQSIYDTASIALAPLGSRKVVGDRVFRYAKVGEAVAAGVCLAQTSSVALTKQSIKATPSTNASAGSYSVSITVPNSAGGGAAFGTADLLADGTLAIQTGTGDGTTVSRGHSYRIKSHAAGTTGDAVAVKLYDPLAAAIYTTDRATVVANPYNGVVISATGLDNVAAGVACVACSDGDYLWIQTYGPACVRTGNVTAAGKPMALTTTGKLEALSATQASVVAIVAQSLQIATTNEFGMVFLTIEP